jgi:hypothetical protein
VMLDEAVDGLLQRDQGREHAAFETPSGQLGEEALDGVEPRAGFIGRPGCVRSSA